MGSTAQSTQIIPSTWTGFAAGSVTPLAMVQVTSSGAYFNCGDASKVMIFVANASSSADGCLWLEPGARWAGSRGLDPSTGSTVYSTATAPIVCPTTLAVSTTVTTFVASTTGQFVAWGPFESATIKSSDQTVYIVNSTVSTRMYVGVMTWGSTN